MIAWMLKAAPWRTQIRFGPAAAFLLLVPAIMLKMAYGTSRVVHAVDEMPS